MFILRFLALAIAARLIRWATPRKQIEVVAAPPTHVVGTCECCDRYVLPDQPHTFMDSIHRPAHLECVQFVGKLN